VLNSALVAAYVTNQYVNVLTVIDPDPNGDIDARSTMATWAELSINNPAPWGTHGCA